MPTYAPHPGRRGALRRFLQIALLAIALTMATGTRTTHPVAGFSTEGAETRLKPSKKPVIEAAFPRESYRPATIARLVIFSREARNVSIQLFRAGTEQREMKPRDEMYGTAVTAARPLGTVRSGQAIDVRDTRLSQRSVLRQAHRLRASGRLCAVRPSTAPSRREPGRTRPADSLLAGLQLPRRRRRRPSRTPGTRTGT